MMSVVAATDDLAGALKEYFGFDAFKAGQREVIEHLMAGRSAAAVFPTGGGKSLCYQLPALMLPGLSLVVSPLIALMKDQIDALAARGIAAARLDSTLDADQYRDVMDRVRRGELQMLYVAPERFNNERFRASIEKLQISLFAVDEAHCISEWGHNFRPDYLKLTRFAARCGAERLFALTATATPSVLEDICREFEITPECAVRTGFYRENLALLTTPLAADRRADHLTDTLKSRPAGPTIVYVTLQRTAEEVAELLCQAGLRARPYHAGMADDLRAEIQDWFAGSEDGIVVATIAFGMGIDKANIRYVYHYNLPKSLENYSQEVGRAGRDGQPARCEMLACADDLSVLENFVYGDTPSRNALRDLINGVLTAGEDFDVSLYELSNAHDIRTLVVRTLLTYLELDGYLEGGTPFYSSYQFHPLCSSEQILGQFEGERREFLAGLFRQATKAKKWFRIDLDAAAANLGVDRVRVVRALDYLGEQQLLEVKTAGVRLRYRRLKLLGDLDALTEDLLGRMHKREQRDIARLREVLDLVTHDGCQASHLGAHFGERLEQPCGSCSWCTASGRASALPGRDTPLIDQAVLQKLRPVRREYRMALTDAVAATRFLCGISSPRLVRAKLTRHDLFGALGHVPFPEVLKHVNSQKN